MKLGLKKLLTPFIFLAIFDVAHAEPTGLELDFYTGLATDLYKEYKQDKAVVLNHAFVLNWLKESNRVERYRTVLANKSGHVVDNAGGKYVDLNWDEVKFSVSAALDATGNTNGLIVCSDDIATKVAIGVGITVGVVALTIATAGLASIAAGGAAALTTTGVSLATGAGNVVATAHMLGAGAFLKTMMVAGVKALPVVLPAAGKAIASAPIINLAVKGAKKGAGVVKGFMGRHKFIAALTIAGVGARAFGGINNAVGSEFMKAAGVTGTINCKNLTVHGRRCYSLCNEKHAAEGYVDDLNEKIFMQVVKKRICIDGDNNSPTKYMLFEANGASKGKQLMLTDAQIERIKGLIPYVRDQGQCNWKANNVDMYFGKYFYDPDTLEPAPYPLFITNTSRIDN
ncbi:MAG: hypothetical protein LBL21_04815 [Rickettsiales bacterium]|jgi:hypothetical protein|nr:hypothetical protein [Rickettsiales bacterium]